MSEKQVIKKGNHKNFVFIWFCCPTRPYPDEQKREQKKRKYESWGGMGTEKRSEGSPTSSGAGSPASDTL